MPHLMRVAFGSLSAAIAIASPIVAQPITVQFYYPPSLLKAGVEGSVRYQAAISKSGKVSSCKIVSTSGNDALNKATCMQVKETARFKPAQDASGKPIKSSYTGGIAWRIPNKAATAMTEVPFPQ